MTHWRMRALVLVMIAGQIMAGAMAGRSIYFAHCGDHHHGHDDGHHDHDHDHDHDVPVGAGHEDHGCLASFDHDHENHSGNDHRCRCPHVHVKSDMRLVRRQRIGEDLTNAPATLPSTAFEPPFRAAFDDVPSHREGPSALARSSLAQALAIRASRLLI